eukprot:1375625-Pyramimonas_sp.AAC.1
MKTGRSSRDQEYTDREGMTKTELSEEARWEEGRREGCSKEGSKRAMGGAWDEGRRKREQTAREDIEAR